MIPISRNSGLTDVAIEAVHTVIRSPWATRRAIAHGLHYFPMCGSLLGGKVFPLLLRLSSYSDEHESIL